MHAKTIQKLMRWYRANGRHDLPWRTKRTPYRTLVSELMLQQTQVSRVVAFFERWMRLFPSLKALHQASEEEVLKAWQGLGYYRRARALHAIAKSTTRLPEERDALLALPSVGPYTAEAMLAFAHDQIAYPFDTNLNRVFNRITGEEDQARWREILKAWQKRRSPREVNEALMDFASAICTARSPQCPSCPLRKKCASFAANGPITDSPTKRSSAPKATHAIAIMRTGRKVLLKKKGGILRIALDGQPFRKALQAAALKQFGVEIAVRPACATLEIEGQTTSIHRCSLLLGKVEAFTPMDKTRASRLEEWQRVALSAANLR